MDTEDLRLLLAIAEHGSYRAAAEAVGVAQPLITRRMHRLERALGRALLDRGPAGTSLTDDGREAVADARRLLEIADAMLGRRGERNRTRLRLGAAATAAGSFLAEFLARWIPAHPDVELTLLEDGALNLRDRLLRHECDLAVVSPPVPPSMDHHLVTRVTVQALIPRDHPLASDDGPLPVAALHRQRVLLNGGRFISTSLLQAAAALADCELDVVYECSVGQTLAALAEGGLGIAVVGDSVDLRGFDLPRRPIADAHGRLLTFALHVAWLGDRPLPGVALEFAEALAARTVEGDGRPGNGAAS